MGAQVSPSVLWGLLVLCLLGGASGATARLARGNPAMATLPLSEATSAAQASKSGLVPSLEAKKNEVPPEAKKKSADSTLKTTGNIHHLLHRRVKAARHDAVLEQNLVLPKLSVTSAVVGRPQSITFQGAFSNDRVALTPVWKPCQEGDVRAVGKSRTLQFLFKDIGRYKICMIPSGRKLMVQMSPAFEVLLKDGVPLKAEYEAPSAVKHVLGGGAGLKMLLPHVAAPKADRVKKKTKTQQKAKALTWTSCGLQPETRTPEDIALLLDWNKSFVRQMSPACWHHFEHMQKELKRQDVFLKVFDRFGSSCHFKLLCGSPHVLHKVASKHGISLKGDVLSINRN